MMMSKIKTKTHAVLVDGVMCENLKSYNKGFDKFLVTHDLGQRLTNGNCRMGFRSGPIITDDH